MLSKIHAEITKQALREFNIVALERIIAANLYQDRLTGQVGHEEFHFDNNAFEKSYTYMEEQRRLVLLSLKENEAPAAWSAFGRLTHTAQDFYAHSNYIDLWLACQPNGTVPIVSEIDPLIEDLIHSPALCSGKIYLPLEALTSVKVLVPVVKHLLPRDSHAWMNLDHPGQGPNFFFAYHAAIKRTKIEFEKTVLGLPEELYRAFVGEQTSTDSLQE